jgi:AraC-like DNA-binding protein
MENLRVELAQLIRSFAVGDGVHASPVPGTFCVKFSQTTVQQKQRWVACLAIIAQGSKEIVLGGDLFRLDETSFSATPVELPVISRIVSASPQKPLLGLLIHLDPVVLSEVASQMSGSIAKEPTNGVRAIFLGKSTDAMLEAAIRLVRLFRSPDDARVLGPLIVRELFYHLLRGPQGSAVHQFICSGSKMHKISQAVHKLRTDLTDAINVQALAKAAKMSRSAFFKNFSDMAGMSPIQYQKRLRLLEARRLMMDEGETAEGSAFRVGYNSASQFSREYSRMFGDSPLRDSARIKKTGDLVNQA